MIKTIKNLKDLCLDTPLYQELRIDPNHFGFVDFLDCYCIECNERSTFQRIEMYRPQVGQCIGTNHYEEIYELRLFRFKCSRNEKHIIQFILFTDNQNVSYKIGQFPSMADLAIAEIQKYHNVLGKEKFREFSRAVGLLSHGVGIGAFVYLRRIFEGLVEEAHIEAMKDESWDEENYTRPHIGMNDKIKMLKKYLPDFLVENTKIYAILSKGIHELNEDECKDYFGVIKAGIELILDQKIELKERKEKEQKARTEIQKVHQKLTGNTS